MYTVITALLLATQLQPLDLCNAKILPVPDKPLAAAKVRSCEKFVDCVDGPSKLSAEEHGLLLKMLRIVTPKVTAEEISSRLGLKPYSVVPPSQGICFSEGTSVSSAVWHITGKRESLADPHINVLFFNGKAVSFRLFGAALQRSATIQLLE